MPPIVSAARVRFGRPVTGWAGAGTHIARAVGTTALAGAMGLGYAAGIEVRSFTLRRRRAAGAAPGHQPLRVLHLSDLHLTPRQGRKLSWLRSLAGSRPDLVVDTGDNLAHLRAVPPLLEALGPLLDVPGVFVFGSNDYFAPTLRNPVRYLLPDDGLRNTRSPAAAVGRAEAAVDRPRLARPDQHHRPADRARHQHRVRRRRRPAPGLRRPRRGRRGRPGRRRPAARGHPCAVPAGARPVRRRRLRRHLRRPHPRRPACLPGYGALVTNCDLDTRRAPRGCTGIRPTPGRAIRAAPGCTSRRAPAPRRTPRCGSAAGPRRPC